MSCHFFLELVMPKIGRPFLFLFFYTMVVCCQVKVKAGWRGMNGWARREHEARVGGWLSLRATPNNTGIFSTF